MSSWRCSQLEYKSESAKTDANFSLYPISAFMYNSYRYSPTSQERLGGSQQRHTLGHFHIKIGKTECINSPVKRFTDVYLYILVVVLSPL